MSSASTRWARSTGRSYRAFAASGKDLDFERWSLDAWTIIRKPTIPQQWEKFRGWGVSPRYVGPVPEIVLVNYNLRYSTYVTRFDGDLRKDLAAGSTPTSSPASTSSAAASTPC